MILEERDYHVFTGKLNEVVALYEHEGIALQQKHLGRLSAPSRPTSARSRPTRTSGRYDSYDEREQRRAALQADPRWKDFLARLQPLLHTQQNRILIPTSFSPLR